MIDRRKTDRVTVLLFLPIFEIDSNKIIGYIADINEKGLLLFSKESIGLDKSFSFLIRLQDLKEALLDKNISEERILFQAQSRWINVDTNPVFYRTDFIFIELSHESRNAISHLTHNVTKSSA